MSNECWHDGDRQLLDKGMAKTLKRRQVAKCPLRQRGGSPAGTVATTSPLPSAPPARRFTGSIAQALQGRGPLADARAAQLAVFASAPLHGGEVPDLLTPELLALISSDQATPAQAALAVIASAPGVRRVLISTQRQEHWDQAVTALDRPVLSRQTLQRIADVLGT